MIRHARAVMAWAALSVLGVGCSSTPQARFYTLSPTSTPGATSPELSVAVGPVAVPAARKHLSCDISVPMYPWKIPGLRAGDVGIRLVL